jgi:hypothetical protein
MKKLIFFLLFANLTTKSYSQSNWENFNNLSSPKKWWVISHPFKARKALKISKEVTKIADSIRKTNLLDGDASGGQVDAFRHAFWMARLRQGIGKSAARSLGKAHEKENYLMYKEPKLEEGVVPDKISSDMDLFNNDVGLNLIHRGEKTPKNGLIYRVINAIKAGKMRVIKKDTNKRFVTCEGNIIPKDSLKGKWINTKCLVESNYQKQ